MRRTVREFKNAFLIVVGICSAALGLKGFLLPVRFIDGGVTGISMLGAEILHLPLGLLIFIFNIPFIAIGYRQIGKMFALKSALAITGLAAMLFLVTFPDVTYDKLLTAVFGGLFIGAGIGLAIRGGAVLDGTEIAALLISRKSNLLRVGDVILILNVFIFFAAAFFLGVESAMYSILTYLSASKTIDFLLHGVEEYTAVTIISEKSADIKAALVNNLNRGVTVFLGQGGVGSTGTKEDAREILFCVLTRLEIGGLRSTVLSIDPAAFITTHTLSDVQGGMLKRTAIH